MKDEFYLWLDSESGKKANDFTTLTAQEYLTNRLYHAFYAGKNLECEKCQQLQKTIEWYEAKLKELKARLAELQEPEPS